MALLSGTGNKIYRRAKKSGRYLKFLPAGCGGEKSRESAPSEIEKLGELERERRARRRTIGMESGPGGNGGRGGEGRGIASGREKRHRRRERETVIEE